MQFLKEMKKFHIGCLKGLMILVLIGGCFLSHVYHQLESYEKSTQSGALDYFVSLLIERNYDELYRMSQLVQTQFNPKEQYIQYLKDNYEWRDLSQVSFKEMYYSDNIYTYYDMLVNQETIGTLMVREVSNGVTDYSALLRMENRHIYIESDQEVTFYVNGIEVSEDYHISETKNYSCFDGLEDVSLAPLANRYHVDNLIDEPVVTTEKEDLVVIKDVISDYYYLGHTLSEQQEELAKRLLQTFATTYSMWTSEDESFYHVRQLIYRNTELYSALATFNNRFFSLHDWVEFENWQFEDLALLGSNGLIGTVSFDYVVLVGENRRVYSNTYQLSFMEFEGTWLLVSMSINNE